MRIELGAQVRTSDDKDIGTIDKLVLDPASGDVKSAVVRKGFILTRDVEIPIANLEVEAKGAVRVSCTSDQVDDLPRFNEASYTTPPPDHVPLYGYPTGALLWPAGWPATYPYPGYAPDQEAAVDREVNAILRRQDLENAVVGEGSDVKSRDGEKVGEIHSLSFDSATGQLSSFVVRKGFLLTEDLELPAHTMTSVDDGVVYLNLDKEQVDNYVTSLRR